MRFRTGWCDHVQATGYTTGSGSSALPSLSLAACQLMCGYKELSSVQGEMYVMGIAWEIRNMCAGGRSIAVS
jgi:hypothetical protein